MRKKLLISIFILIFCMGVVQASDNSTVGDDLDDCEIDENDLEVASSPIDDIDEKIRDADENDTVELEEEYFQSDYAHELNFTKSISLEGSADMTKIEGYGTNLTVNVESGNINITKTSFINYCDVFFNIKGELNLVNCTFVNVDNIYSNSKNLNLVDCEFINSNIELSNIENSVFKNSNITLIEYNIKNCIFDQSFFNVEADGVKIYDSIIANNTRFNQVSYYLLIQNSRFENLSQSFSQYGRKLDIVNSTFIANNINGDFISYEYTKATIRNSQFINNTCNGYLLNFNNESSMINITECVFINNTCSELLYWSYSNFNQYYSKMEQINLNNGIEFSKNVVISNYNKNGKYSKIHIEPKIGETSGRYRYASKIVIENNFLGFNIEDNVEFSLIPIFEFVTPIDDWENLISWTNVKLNYFGDNEYYLSFTNKTDTVTDMPECVFSIKNKATDSILVSSVKIGEHFKLTTSDVYIINEGIKIVNKAQAQIYVLFDYFDYDHINIKIYLMDGANVLKSKTISFKTTAVFSGGTVESDDYLVKTNAKGCALAYKTGTEYSDLRYLDYTPKYFNFVVSFADEDYGLTQVSYEKMKIQKTKCVLGASSTSTRYKVAKKIKITLKNKRLKENIKECYIQIYVYKSGKKVLETYKIVKNGVVYYKLSKLNVGTYKIKIKSYDSHYEFDTKTITFKVKKALTKAKATKITAKVNKTKYFKIKVTRSSKAVKYIKVKVKVYTGKKYKSFIIKTNKYGIAKFNVKGLNAGKHKVVITSKNSNYYINKKSSIRILHLVQY